MLSEAKTLKVLHWATSYPNPSRGKPYDCIFVKEHIQSVAPYCENRVLFLPAEEPSEGKIVEIDRTVEVGILTDRIYFKTIRPLWWTNIYIRIVLFCYFIKMIIIERFYPDIIHVHFHQAGLIAELFCRIFRIKMVVTEHWSAFVGWPELPAVRFTKAAGVFQYARWIFTVSHNLKNGIEERCKIDLFGKTSVIPNSVDTIIFHSRAPQNNSFSKKRKNILVVARLAEEKDLPVLFEALNHLQRANKRFFCEIIGSGDPKQYKNQIYTLGLQDKVRFLGPKPKSEIAERMRSSDALVISSFIENSPCVIGEALCTGLPVVSTNVGGISELLDETNGILVPPREPKTLAAAIEDALFHRTFDREAISKKAQAHFSYEAIGGKIFNVYKNLVNKS